MQKARRQPGLPCGAIGLRLLVSGWIQGLFTPRQGCFSVFARATNALSVYQEYLALERGRPGFTQDFTSLALLRYPIGPTSLRVRGYHPLWRTFPGPSARVVGSHVSGPTTPGGKPPGLGSGVFARRYWRHLVDFFSSGY